MSDVLNAEIERLQRVAELDTLRARAEKAEREVERLRAQNERLRDALRNVAWFLPTAQDCWCARPELGLHSDACRAARDVLEEAVEGK